MTYDQWKCSDPNEPFADHEEETMPVEEERDPGKAAMEAAEEIERLRVALKNLHDWYVDYARINNLFNGDGSPGTFHELLEARKLL
jgi:hypothetical protein